jgi:hypothetical protein
VDKSTTSPREVFSSFELGALRNISAWQEMTRPGGDAWWDAFPDVRDEVYSPCDAALAKGAYDVIMMEWDEQERAPEEAGRLDMSIPDQLILKP